MGVGERLHREGELYLGVSGLVDARGFYHLHYSVYVYEAGVQRETWTTTTTTNKKVFSESDKKISHS